MRDKLLSFIIFFVFGIILIVNSVMAASPWSVNLNIKLGIDSKGIRTFGTASGATDLYNAGIDLIEPPSPPDYFEVAFLESQAVYTRLNKDIKSVADAKNWTVKIVAPTAEVVNVSWAVIPLNWANTIRMIQLDPNTENPTGVIIDMKTTKSFLVTGLANDNKTDKYIIEFINTSLLDTIYPVFSGYKDNNGTLINSGTALFNVTVAGTNGTVILNIGGSKIAATSLGSNKYNTSIILTAGVYLYNWTSYGSGASHNLNISNNRFYTVKTGECSVNSDCASKCTGDFYNSAGQCISGACSYTLTNCNLQDGWYDTGNFQNISTGQCTLKEQKEQTFKDYSCGASGCQLSGSSSSRWIDTGINYNKPETTSCDDSNLCTITDRCSAGVCSGTARSCDDSISCTIDSCDPSSGCANSPDNSKCSDAFSCTDDSCNALSGCINNKNDNNCNIATGEKCIAFGSFNCASQVKSCIGIQDGISCDDGLQNCTLGRTCLSQICQGGAAKDCSQFNIQGINSCTDSSDSNFFTKDYRSAFTSSCLPTGACNAGEYTITHSCNKTCNGCEQDSDLKCSADKCEGNYFADYPVNGTCNLQTCVGDNSTSGACKPALIDDLRCIGEVNITLTIDSGVNFISVPLLLNNYSVEKIFEGNLDKIARIYSYENGWKIYYSANPGLSSLKELNTSKGYIVFAEQGFNLELKGYNKLNNGAISRPAFILNQGWNLFSPILSANLSSLNLKYAGAFKFKKDSGEYILIGNDSILDNKEGYWIYMNSGQVYTT